MKSHKSCPDYDFWDRQHEFAEFDLVHLWLDTEPPEHYQPSGKLRAIEEQLLQARMDGHLDWWSQQDDPGDYATYEVWYVRKALIRYAESVAQRPAFLFPEDRAISSVHAAAALSDSGSPHDPGDGVRNIDHSSAAPGKHSGSGLFTVKEFCARYPEFKLGAVRFQIFCSKERAIKGQLWPPNGLASAIIRKGRAIRIDAEAYIAWYKRDQREPVKQAIGDANQSSLTMS